MNQYKNPHGFIFFQSKTSIKFKGQYEDVNSKVFIFHKSQQKKETSLLAIIKWVSLNLLYFPSTKPLITSGLGAVLKGNLNISTLSPAFTSGQFLPSFNFENSSFFNTFKIDEARRCGDFIFVKGLFFIFSIVLITSCFRSSLILEDFMLNLKLVPDDDDGIEGTLSSIDEDNEDRDSSVGGTDEEGGS